MGKGLGALFQADSAPGAGAGTAGPGSAGAGAAGSGAATTVPVPAGPAGGEQGGRSAGTLGTGPARRATVAERAAEAVSRETSASREHGVAGAYFAELPIDAITPNPNQPREVFDEEALEELVHSIREVGLLQPVVVREEAPGRYELIMGERRWRATQEAGLTRIPAIVRSTPDDRMLLDALLENLHRVQLNPLEEAAAYDQLLRDFSCTHEELANRIGRSRPQITNTLRLLQLSRPVRRLVAAGEISAGHARALLKLSDPEQQDALAKRIIAEGLSVRSTEEITFTMTSEEGEGGAEGEARRAKGPRAGRRLSPAFNELANRLSDRFDTRVKVDLGQKKGKIVVEFASVEDLERILEAMAPGEHTAFHRAASMATVPAGAPEAVDLSEDDD
ncbi:ParB/RepB/Spo0J family partition protein [Allostreptomyces psammosilenae]|uniref:ParB/RepB/Spo0J family partition protein n=1 Tax=Allostreptomyces psammosilenae TaxID=1892865 RepID=UPI0035E407DA